MFGYPDNAERKGKKYSLVGLLKNKDNFATFM